MPDIEVKFVQVIYPTGGNNRNAEADGETGLEIYSVFHIGVIRNDEARSPDLGKNFVGDPVDVFLPVDTK